MTTYIGEKMIKPCTIIFILQWQDNRTLKSLYWLLVNWILVFWTLRKWSTLYHYDLKFFCGCSRIVYKKFYLSPASIGRSLPISMTLAQAAWLRNGSRARTKRRLRHLNFTDCCKNCTWLLYTSEIMNHYLVSFALCDSWSTLALCWTSFLPQICFTVHLSLEDLTMNFPFITSLLLVPSLQP